MSMQDKVAALYAAYRLDTFIEKVVKGGQTYDPLQDDSAPPLTVLMERYSTRLNAKD